MTAEVILPIDGLLARAKHGKLHKFSWPASAGFTGYQVEELLQRYGIPCWGREVAFDAGDDMALLVKMRQASWAEYLLCRGGIPLSSQLLDERHRYLLYSHGATLPPAWGVPARAQGCVGPIVALLAAILRPLKYRLPEQRSERKIAAMAKKQTKKSTKRKQGRRRNVLSLIDEVMR